MFGFFHAAMLILVCMSVLLSGCGAKEVAINTSQAGADSGASFSVTCVGVLPVDSGIDYDGTLSYDDAKSLSLGVATADRLLLQQLSGRPNVRFVTADQLSGLDQAGSDHSLARAQLVGKHLSCNAVLETTLQKYINRKGSQFSADSPASVAFEYRLIAVDSGMALCRGKFDETQLSVMENLYAWGKARSRGFAWISAEELLREGFQERFADCSYLISE